MGDWLRAIGLEKYAALFAEQEITREVLPHLTEADIEGLGLPIGARRRLLVEVARLRPGPAPASAVEPHPARTAGPAAPAATHGAERRQLTVMFCDLVGSTALSTQLDPEELRELMQAYRKASSDVVARFDGHVAQYLGDGLMVYFGWPRAHEDDAERGVRAALGVVQAVQGLRTAHPLAVRVGLATGPVVVGETSRLDSSEARLAVGEAPNLAARLQGLAGRNEVVIAPATRRLLGDAFALTDLGAHSLKGIAEPVQAWRVDAVRRTEGRFEAAHAGTDLTPLVGRDEEVSLLLRRWQQARDGEGQMVTIGGEAGIGKSRLSQTLRERIPDEHTVLRFQCSPYHANSALYPFIQQIEFAAGFQREDPPDVRLSKLEAILAGDPARVAEAAPLLATLLSLPVDRYPPLQLTPQRQKDKTLEALTGQVEAQAARRPVLVLFEDLHWIDPTTQEVLDALIPRLHALRILLVATHRPEYAPRWAGQPGVTSLTLSRLERRQVGLLVAKVTGGRALPPEVLAEILAHTDGVPLFVEELTKSVIESGTLREADGRYTLEGPLESLAIPTSLRDSLAARLDRLASVKEFAQIGACIGREFSYDLLSRVATPGGEPLEAALEKLVGAGLIARRGAPPEATYTFKHALVQDAAYDSLLRSRRHQLHARIAAALEDGFRDEVAQRPEWLAHHHTQAGNLAAAIPLWRRAGALAVERVALQEAVAHFRKALALTDQQPPSADRDGLELTIRQQLNAAWAGLHGWADAEIGVNTEAILRLARGQGDAHTLMLGLWWMWTNTITQGRIADSLPWARRLTEEGQGAEDTDLRMFGPAATMVSHFFLGRLEEARVESERALALYDPRRAERWIQLTGHDLRTLVEVWGCQLIWLLGHPDRALEVGESSSAHARTVGHAFNLVWALTFGAYVFAYRRDAERLLACVTEADRLAREQGVAFIHQVSVPQIAGLAHLHAGRPREAATVLRQAIESWTRLGGRVRIPYLKSALAQALALEGDSAGALQLLDECLEQIEEPACQERIWLAEVLRLKGAILSDQGRAEEAESLLRGAIECAREQGAKSWELRATTTLAALLAKSGRRAMAREALAAICGWFTEGEGTKDLREARALLAALGDGPGSSSG